MASRTVLLQQPGHRPIARRPLQVRNRRAAARRETIDPVGVRTSNSRWRTKAAGGVRPRVTADVVRLGWYQTPSVAQANGVLNGWRGTHQFIRVRPIGHM